MANKKILIGLTTAFNPNWRKSIGDLTKFGIEEIALFPTVLEKEERQEMYKLLENSSIRNIPHVHLRQGMDLAEVEYLINKFGSKIFNIHSAISSLPSQDDYKYLKKNIYIENTDVIPIEKELEEYGGLCIDFAHWEAANSIFKDAYNNFEDLIKKYKIGCCHISAVPTTDKNLIFLKDQHRVQNLQNLDYIKKYLEYLPDIISIELVNPVEELIEAKKYLDKIINA